MGVAKTSQEWPLVIALSFFAALLVFSGGYWLTRKLATMSPPPPVAPPVAAPPTAQPEPEYQDTTPVRRTTNRPPGPGEVVERPPEKPAELTPDDLERLKRGVKVKMYMTGPCTLCSTARTFLKGRRYNLTELDIDASPTDKVLLESVNPAASVPTFEVEGKVLIGYDRQILDKAIEDAARSRAD